MMLVMVTVDDDGDGGDVPHNLPGIPSQIEPFTVYMNAF